MWKRLLKSTSRTAASAAAGGGVAAAFGRSATRGGVDLGQLALRHLDTVKAAGKNLDDAADAAVAASKRLDDVADVGTAVGKRADDAAGAAAAAGRKLDDVAEAGARFGGGAREASVAFSKRKLKELGTLCMSTPKKCATVGAGAAVAAYTVVKYADMSRDQRDCVAECLPPNWPAVRAGEEGATPAYFDDDGPDGAPRCTRAHAEDAGDCDAHCAARCEDRHPVSIGGALGEAVGDIARETVVPFVGGVMSAGKGVLRGLLGPYGDLLFYAVVALVVARVVLYLRREYYGAFRVPGFPMPVATPVGVPGTGLPVATPVATPVAAPQPLAVATPVAAPQPLAVATPVGVPGTGPPVATPVATPVAAPQPFAARDRSLPLATPAGVPGTGPPVVATAIDPFLPLAA